jgi:hypothetical protein
MDAVDPELVDQAEEALRATPGVLGTRAAPVTVVGHQGADAG